MSLRLAATVGAGVLTALGVACNCTSSGCHGPADCGQGLVCGADGVCAPEPDAGVPLAWPPFTPTACGTNVPPLSCVTFSPDGGGGFVGSSVAAIDGGFLVAIARGSPRRIELYAVGPGGFGAPLTTWDLPTSPVNSLSVSTSGEAWVVSWLQFATGQSAATLVRCASGSTLDAIPGAPALVTTSAVTLASSAVNSAGDVAVAAADNRALFGIGDARLQAAVGVGGCPAALRASPDSGVYAPAVLSVADGGFWAVTTGWDLGVFKSTGTGFALAADLASFNPIYDQATVATADGARLMTLVSYDLLDGGYGLMNKPIRVDRTPPQVNVQPNALFDPFAPALIWTNSICGAGCLASAIEEGNGARSLIVAFTDDSAANSPLGALYYSAACAKSPQPNGLSAAWSAELLGLLYSDGAEAQLIVCQKPAF